MYSFNDLSKILGVSPELVLKAFQDIEDFFAKEFGTVPETADINSLLNASQAELVVVGVANQSSLELLLGRI